MRLLDSRLSLATALLLCTGPSAALADDSINGPTGAPQSSFLYDNFCAALELLESAIDAHGGDAWIEGELNFRAHSAGHLYLQGHYQRPWTHHDHAREGELLYLAPRLGFKKLETFNYKRPAEGFSVLSRERGVVRIAGNSEAEELEGEELAERWDGELFIFPREFLRQALANRSSLRWLGSDGSRDVLQYESTDGELRALLLDATSHLLQRVEYIDHWKLKGDRLEWVEFSDYDEVAGVQVAHSIASHGENFASQSDSRLQLTQVEVGGPMDFAEFELPAAFKAAHPDFEVSELEPEASAFLPTHDLGQGVFIIDVPEIDARSMLVEFADFTVIIEGGDHSAISERILATAEHLCPDKPVRYLAMSHHHPLYTGGIRSFVNQGVTILSTPGNVDYIRDLATRPYRIEPDAQQRSPVEPVFELVEEVRVIEDATQRLELHAFDSSTHTDEYVLTFVPGLKLGFLGDLVYSGKTEEPRPARGRTRAVFDLVRERGLDIEQLSQTWYLEEGKMLYPFTEIEEAVRLADEAQ